jgi:murein DD-endopeptidase MepM/ murein hydrolase activator NlpD
VEWHPAVTIPTEDYKVLDLTKGDWEAEAGLAEWTIGKYDEVREGVYNTPLFGGVRNVHIGLDVGGPVGTAVMAIAGGTVHSAGYNPAAGDYGHVVVIEHCVGDAKFWFLYGHLSAASTARKASGQPVAAGEVIGWFGGKDENGGWAPHVHLQLAVVEPTTHDMPGVVAKEDREMALTTYPDPRLVLGPLY